MVLDRLLAILMQLQFRRLRACGGHHIARFVAPHPRSFTRCSALVFVTTYFVDATGPGEMSLARCIQHTGEELLTTRGSILKFSVAPARE